MWLWICRWRMNTLVTSQYQPRLSSIAKIFSRWISQSDWNIQIKLNYLILNNILVLGQVRCHHQLKQPIRGHCIKSWGTEKCRGWAMVMVLNTTFKNISVISWRSVLLVKETGLPGENRRPVASHWQTPRYEWDLNSHC